MCFSGWYVIIIWCSHISSIDVVHCLKSCWFLWNVWITSFYVEAISLRIDHHGSLMSNSQQIWWQFCARYLECLYCENYQMGHMITQYSSKEKLHWWTILEQGDAVTNDLWNNSCSESITNVSAMWVKWQMWRHLLMRHKRMHQLMVITVLVLDLESHHLLQMRKSLGFHHLTTSLENLHLQFPELGRFPKPVPDFQEPYQPQHPQQCDQELLHLQGPVHNLHHQIRNHQAQGRHVGVLAWDPEKGPKKLVQNFL